RRAAGPGGFHLRQRPPRRKRWRGGPHRQLRGRRDRLHLVRQPRHRPGRGARRRHAQATARHADATRLVLPGQDRAGRRGQSRRGGAAAGRRCADVRRGPAGGGRRLADGGMAVRPRRHRLLPAGHRRLQSGPQRPQRRSDDDVALHRAAVRLRRLHPDPGVAGLDGPDRGGLPRQVARAGLPGRAPARPHGRSRTGRAVGAGPDGGGPDVVVCWRIGTVSDDLSLAEQPHPMRLHAWSRSFRYWEWCFALAAAAVTALVWDGADSVGRALAASGCLLAMAVWYLMLGRRLITAGFSGAEPDLRLMRRYRLGVLALFLLASLAEREVLVLLVMLVPHLFWLVPWKPTVPVVVALNFVRVPVLVLDGEPLGAVLAALPLCVLGAVASVGFGVFIHRVIEQSVDRFELIEELK